MRIRCPQIGVPDRGAAPVAAGFWLVEPPAPGRLPSQLDAAPPPVQPATASADTMTMGKTSWRPVPGLIRTLRGSSASTIRSLSAVRHAGYHGGPSEGRPVVSITVTGQSHKRPTPVHERGSQHDGRDNDHNVHDRGGTAVCRGCYPLRAAADVR